MADLESLEEYICELARRHLWEGGELDNRLIPEPPLGQTTFRFVSRFCR